MQYAIGIVVHNGLKFVRPCLESVIRYSPGANIIVVDSGSDDGKTVKYLLKLAREPEARIRLIACPTNMGYGWCQNEAWTIASLHSNMDFFIALNSDVEVLNKDWLERLTEKFRTDEKLALCGPEGGFSCLDDNGRGYANPGCAESEVEYIEGWCLAVRASVLRDWQAFFDPIYHFCYCEDSDLSLRLRSKGYHIALAPVPVSHIRGATVRALSEAEGHRLAEAYHKNHELFRSRWAHYLKTRRFEEP